MNYGRRVLIVGLAVIVISAVLYFAIPAIGYAMLGTGAPSDETALGVIQLLMRFLARVLPPLGATLIAAGTVLIHLDMREQMRDSE
ncbi:hypothetical protein ACEXQE_06730 [Herbiconiux sp. P17]|uniref:hypothetical protein n=1 Tax=Herbiconiux wuyangfengii TaxID=3342794 RepID=UPI0035B84C47